MQGQVLQLESSESGLSPNMEMELVGARCFLFPASREYEEHQIVTKRKLAGHITDNGYEMG